MPEPVVITPPAGYAVTLAEAKVFLGLESGFTDHDEMIEDILIPAASDAAEAYMWRKIMSQTWVLDFFGFPEESALLLSYDARKPAVISYVDTLGDPQIVEDEVFEIVYGRLCLAKYQDWPLIEPESVISIEYSRGWPEDEVPKAVKTAMLSLIYRQYETRCAAAGDGFFGILSPYRLFEVT